MNIPRICIVLVIIARNDHFRELSHKITVRATCGICPTMGKRIVGQVARN